MFLAASLLVPLGGALADGDGAPAAQTDGAAPVAQTAAPSDAAADDNALVCRSESATGSMLTKRTCHKRREWESMRNLRQNVDKLKTISATENGR
ncbi:MAG: hypothetical protein WDM91_03245 [Rhizomicrobium sp.]